jgi:hypothetical protein
MARQKRRPPWHYPTVQTPSPPTPSPVPHPIPIQLVKLHIQELAEIFLNIKGTLVYATLRQKLSILKKILKDCEVHKVENSR